MSTDIFALSVFIAGVFSFFSPCIFPLIPIYMGQLTDTNIDLDDKSKRGKYLIDAILRTLAFILGISTIFFVLGFGAGFFGSLFTNQYVRYVLGGIIIFMGLHQMEIISFNFMNKTKKLTVKRSNRGKIINAYILGFTFSFGWTPCIGPILGSVLAIAAGGSSSFYGASLMLIYSLGLSIPFMLMALASSILMKYFNKMKKHMLLIKRIGGLLIIFMGILLIFDKLNILL